MRTLNIIALGLMATVGTAANAQQGTSYQLMAMGHYDAAVQRLEAKLKAEPETPEIALNLATAYARTGRVSEARSLYRAVLTQPTVELDMVNGGVATSHDVARRGLSTLVQTLATR